MKRAVSRASKISVDVQDSSENSFLSIPDVKWHEFLEREETDLFILGLRDEIIEKCLEICFEKYLEKQAVSFTVHCSYLAWCKVLNMYYMFRDPGDIDDPVAKESWEPDPEPTPSDVDTWGSHCMETVSPMKPTKKTKKELTGRTPKISEICRSESVESCSFASNLFGFEEEGGSFLLSLSFSSSRLSAFSEKKSIFTRTLSTPREDLPLIDPLASLKEGCNDNQKKKK